MFNAIRKLQNKSSSTREHIALFVAAVITIFIAGIWIATLNDPFESDKEEGLASTEEKGSPFDIIKEQFKELKTLLK